MTPVQHGWYPVPRPAGEFKLPTMASATGANVKDLPLLHIPTYKTEMLHLSHVLAVRAGIHNSATLVVLGLTAKGDSRVVKLTWLSKYHAERYERVLQHIKTTPISGVPNVLYHGILGQSENASAQDDFPDKRLFCVITDRPGVTIARELS